MEYAALPDSKPMKSPASEIGQQREAIQRQWKMLLHIDVLELTKKRKVMSARKESQFPSPKPVKSRERV